jgi:hypothetical protein
MKLANSRDMENLRDVAFATHPFPPDEEGGIYAVLDEAGKVIPIKPEQVQIGATPNIACHYVCGWTVLTRFNEGLFTSDSPNTAWFETFVFTDLGQPESELLKELAGQTHKVVFNGLVDLYASTLKQALRNHARGMRLARKSPRR